MFKDGKRIILGLTGNICSGKTTVMEVFKKLGCSTISSDDLAHDILENNEDINKRVNKYFATTNRKKLAEIIFSDCRKRILLETILHPAIEEKIAEHLGKLCDEKCVIIEIPLLYETGWDKKVDYVVFVSCPSNVRKERFYKGRKGSLGDFECRDTAQLSEINKARKADFVIDNSGDIEKTKTEVAEVIKTIRSNLGVRS